MAAEIGKQCTITNNSGKDFVLTLAIPGDEIANNAAAVTANGQLEVLKTVDGNTIIKSNSAGTLILDHSYKPGGNQTGYVKDYDLVAGDTSWLYPLGTADAVQAGSNGTLGFPSLTIDAGNGKAIAQAAKFYQAVSAYAGSPLISDYITALEATKTATTAEEIAATMNAFFSGTTDYKDVTLAAMSAIHDYYTNFPAIWAEFKDNLTYYLYGSDGSVASFQGTLNLKKSGALDPLKPAGGYTCTFIPATNPTDTSVWNVDATKQVTLNYSDGMFVNDKSAQASVTMKGNFLLKSLFTNQEKDDSVLLVLCGNVNGIVCVGFDSPQASTKSTPTPMALQSAQEFWDSLIHPKSQLEIGISVAFFCGAVALLGGIIRAIYAVYKYASATNSAPKVTEAIDGQINKANGRAQNLVGQHVTKPEPYRIRDSEHGAQITKDLFRVGNMIEAFERQKWAATSFLELSSVALGEDGVRTVQQCLTDGRTSTQKLRKASLDDMRKVIETELPKLNIIQGQLKTLQTDAGFKLSDMGRSELSKNIDKGDTLIESVNEATRLDNEEELERDFVLVPKYPWEE